MRAHLRPVAIALAVITVIGACTPAPKEKVRVEPPLYPNETPELRALINEYAEVYELPPSLVHRLAIRESTHNPAARNGPYYGLLQILPATARSMGFQGQPRDLLDAETNLKYALKYLKGAWMLSDGNHATAIQWYARGYYYEAKRRGMLVETGLRAAKAS
ncbi:transglycosylase SLT domain-containing protein [Sulfitobacter sp. D35]|uniref:transglycosylase SLT domain-containing protein n=1 Tax=Sulfitobacter sp. D35 TaxID=3083252 RepID=UPI00296E7FC4|nr:transglycosylase SLT domain-containing protein [Sulfitobacter sp. D35]MDW4496835.1 transglycosylase SLT domain-containing protein [Sulfitobacter sp. D35]